MMGIAERQSKHPTFVSQSGRKPRSPSTLASHNIIISGRRTSVRLEPEMWDGLCEIASREHLSLHQICTSISLRKSDESSLTAAIRVFIMRYYRDAATEEGHRISAHGSGLTPGMYGQGQHCDNQPGALLTKTSFV